VPTDVVLSWSLVFEACVVVGAWWKMQQENWNFNLLGGEWSHNMVVSKVSKVG